MSNFAFFFKKVKRKVDSWRLEPIHIYCLHHVSREEDPIVCCKGDWISDATFKETIQALIGAGYHFISLSGAQNKIKNDLIRIRKYAVLTFDDGYRSSLPAFHWLEGQGIPYTLFLNTKYLDGISVSTHILNHARTIKPDIEQKDIAHNLYLSLEDLKGLSSLYAELGSHGYEHIDATTLSLDCFAEQVLDSFKELQSSSLKTIPFHAYTWGRHTELTDTLLSNLCIIPVLIDGERNINDSSVMHRELFPY